MPQRTYQGVLTTVLLVAAPRYHYRGGGKIVRMSFLGIVSVTLL